MERPVLSSHFNVTYVQISTAPSTSLPLPNTHTHIQARQSLLSYTAKLIWATYTFSLIESIGGNNRLKISKRNTDLQLCYFRWTTSNLCLLSHSPSLKGLFWPNDRTEQRMEQSRTRTDLHRIWGSRMADGKQCDIVHIVKGKSWLLTPLHSVNLSE